MNRVTKIIFFRETLFSERYYNRLGIEILEKSGFDVEVWDCTPFLHPQVHQQVTVSDPIHFAGHRQFLSESEALAAIADLPPLSFVVCMIAYQYGSLSLYRALSKTKLQYGVVMTNAVPVADAAADLRSALDRIRQSSAAQLLNVLFSRVPFRLPGIRPASLLLAGGTRSIQRRHRYPMDGNTTILWAHTRDYDTYLNEKEKPVQEDASMGIFLDEYLPFHPDYVQSKLPPPSGPDSYFPALRRLFDVLERELRIRIVIAAHPLARYDEHPEYFGGRQIIQGKTLELIRKSRFAIAHESTALNFAVLFDKPVLFVTTDEIERNPREARFIHAMAGWLNKTAINADAPLNRDWEKELAVDKDAYARYREAYIKKNGSPEKQTWQILADYLKASES